MDTLKAHETALVYKLLNALMWFTFQKQPIEGVLMAQPDDAHHIGMENVALLQERLFRDTSILSAFIKEDPFVFTNQELSIVLSWKHFVRDTFFLLRHEKEHSVFLRSEGKPLVYGVKGLRDPLE